MLTHTCLTCETKFTKRNNPNRPYKFCSYQCRAEAQKTDKLKRVCAHCGSEFSIWPYEQRAGRSFCAPACHNRAKDQGKTTEAFRLRTSARYAEWRQAVFQRDNFTCQICGARGGELNADHIKRFSDFPALRLKLSNGRTLCKPCHLATPTFGNRRAVAQEA